MSFSLWGMVEGCTSRRTFGAERRLFVILSPLYMFWLTTRKRWWLICGTLLREEGGWIPRFIRSFNDWELEEIISLLNTIQGKQIIESQEYLVFLKETKNGNFSVKLLFKALIDLKMLCSLISSFGVLGVPRKWVFLLGKPIGAKF